MKSTLETITPAIAKKMLEGNESNRPVNQNNLDFLTKEIKTGNFKVTGETIKISNTGRLLDGQHRLLAVIEANETIKSNVCRDLDDETFKYIDTGRPRHASDVLTINGVDNASQMAAIIKFALNFKRGYYSQAAHQYSKGKSKISNHEVAEYYQRRITSLRESHAFGYNKYNKLVVGSQLAGLHYILKAIHKTDADEFCTRLSDGANLKLSSPVFVLREKLLQDKTSKRKMQNTERLALIIKAWNSYRAGKSISRLNWDAAREEFPKAI